MNVTNTIKLTKENYTLPELQNYFTKLVDIKYYIYHDIGISQQIVNKSTNKRICDYMDITKNRDTDNDYNDRIVDTNYIIFNSIINQTKYDENNNIKLNQDIHLYYLDDIKTTLSNYQYIKTRYFSFSKKDTLPIAVKDKNMELLDNLFRDQSITYRKILTNQTIEKNNTEDSINFVKLKKKNIIKLNIDLIELYNMLTSTKEIPFINIRHVVEVGYRIKRTILFKLHKPSFGKSQIPDKMLTNWKNGILDLSKEYDDTEELDFRKDNKFIHMVVKYQSNYMTFYLSENGDILVIFPIIQRKKKKDRQKENMSEHFFKYLDKINDTVIIINNLLNNIEESNTPESKVYNINKSIIEIDNTNIKNIKMNFNKSIPVCNLPTLNRLFREMKLFFYSIGKNKYGFKNVNLYGTKDYIINYLIESFFNNRTVTFEQLKPELKDNFNINEVELRDIYNTVFETRDEKQVIEKRKNNIDKAEIYFDNILGEQKTIIHFTCQNINQLVFVNNLINLIVSGIGKKTKKQTPPKIKTAKKTAKTISLSATPTPSNNNNSSLSLITNDNSNNNSLYEEEVEEIDNEVIEDEKFIPEKIDELEYKGKKVSTYFKNMRKKYDEDFFKGTSYTRDCPASEDRNPIIVSRDLWKYISENKRLSDGLDRVSKDDDIDSDKYRIITGSSEDTKNVYICPRIYCVRCMVPIKMDEFIKKGNTCPYCGGKPLRVKGGAFNDEHTVKIRSHKYWNYTKLEKMKVQCVDCLEKIKYLDYYNNDYKCNKCDSENVNITEDDLIPYLYNINKHKLKIPKILENSLNPMYPRKKKSGNLPCCDKSSVEKKDTESKEDIFKDSTTKLKHDEVALLPNDLNELLNNDTVERVKDGHFVKTESGKNMKRFYKYRFFQNIKILAFLKKMDLINHKLLFRLGTDNVNENNSFIIALHKLQRIVEHENDKTKKVRSKFNMSNIMINLDPVTFASVNNGNLYEIFRVNKEVDIESKNYNDWFDSIKIIKNLDKNSKEVKNLYSAYNNFKKYSTDRKALKNPVYYIDLLSRKDILFDTKYNIVIIEKVIGTNKEISVLCPLYNYNETKETIFILKFIDEKKKEYYEPIIRIHFSKEPKSPEFSFKQDDEQFKNIFKIIKDKCLDNLKTPNNLLNITNLIKESNYQIQYHVINQHFKVIGVILNNKLFIPVIHSGMNIDIPKMKDKKYEIITIKELYENDLLLSYSEFKELKEEFKTNIKKNILEEETVTYTKKNNKEKNINGIITKNKLFIPLLDNENYTRNGNNINRELEINNLLYRNNIGNSNNRSKKMNNYFKQQKDYETNKILVNKTILKDNIVKKAMKKIIANPVLGKLAKKKLILNEFAKLNLENEFSNRLIDELLMTKKNALQFLSERFRAKKTKQVRRNNVELAQNEFNNMREKLYSKKKYKYERNIQQFNTKNIRNKELQNKYKLNSLRNIRNTPINRTAKQEEVKIKVPNVEGGTVDMFGFDAKGEPNLVAGKCTLPFKTRYNSYTNKEKTTHKQNTEMFYDCLPTSNGPICPTGKISPNEVFAKDLHQYGYCDYNKYFDRQENMINLEKKKKFNEEECATGAMDIRRKGAEGVPDTIKITKKCIINQDRKKTAFDKKNPSETFKCLKKTKKGKLYTDKDSADCFIDNNSL